MSEKEGRGRKCPRLSRLCITAAIVGAFLLAYADYIDIYKNFEVIGGNATDASVKKVGVPASKAKSELETAIRLRVPPDRIAIESHIPNEEEFEPPPNGPKLDFYITGFPKCGTSTMVTTFVSHNETFMYPKERCDLISTKPDAVVYETLTAALNSTEPSIKRGIKCPTGICCSQDAVRRLEKWFPDVKLIFGLRHPVSFFQSFYNYRSLGHFRSNRTLPMPSAETLVGGNHYFGAGTLSAKFERYLTRLRRENSTNEWIPFKVLVYHMEQIRDEDDSAILRESLRSFLDLKQPIPPFLHTNRLQIFNGTIDICDRKYDDVRLELIMNGIETQRWIHEEFMTNPNVVLADEDKFYKLMQNWSIDPCTKESE